MDKLLEGQWVHYVGIAHSHIQAIIIETRDMPRLNMVDLLVLYPAGIDPVHRKPAIIRQVSWDEMDHAVGTWHYAEKE